ncbi:putative disease resistance RPP13-like protein 1 [Sesamum alatum]|uniref:Disease resistance RPP13-like protein 1 n=1 Tax=Sesamum alatum TaxID=300844 RepID=A0AAE2C9X9_9LAMI|nr:putative disease resistance RPP13-like protein 1 [Sesamum alatum]
MVLWEAVLSPALQVLFDKLASGEIMEFLKRNNLDELVLEKLKIAYLTNAAMLDDAEKKQYNNPAIEVWLDMLKNAIYEAEDVLDELATEALRCRLEMDSAQYFSKLVKNISPFCGINARIENLIEKLEYIARHKDVLGLTSGENGGSGMMQRCPTTPLLNESQVYGRTLEKEEILKLLVGDDETNCTTTPSILPILGMGGIGKTTLAQVVYNDKRVDEVFNVKAWAYVSDDFSLVRITKALLESATAKPCDTMNLELLQSGLKEMFHKKKFLVVLDDVWNENLDNWNHLLIPFMVGSRGSKIIITTRNREVLSIMDVFSLYHLKEMSEEACWSLFEHHAFGVKGSETYLSLRETGRKIMKKCKGLPLAVKTLGSILSSKFDNDHWNEVLNSNIWDIPLQKNAILPSLRLSYHYLPSNLKRCFAYCSIFPKGYEFDKKNLVLLWMAGRSFLQESVQDKTRYAMHDLLNDLAQSVSRTMCFHLQENWEKRQLFDSFEKVRHFSCSRSKYDVYRKFESLNEAKWLRTFLPLPSPQGDEYCYLTKKVPCDLLPKLRCLRVLSFNGYCIAELPDSIGNLKHLRYINLSYTEIKGLPQSFNTLLNLQTLLLSNCTYLTELPAEMGKLINLRYLDIVGSGIDEMPLELGNLVNLRLLPQFIVGSSASGIGNLRNLSHLQESLCISRLENVANSWDARRANLQEKKALNQLSFEWSTNLDEFVDENVASQVLEMSEPNPKLEKVNIKNYPGKRFPTWVGDPSFSKLVSLTLSDCKRCVFLPPAGLLSSLKELDITGMLGIKSVGAEFYGSPCSSFRYFASLEKLSFKEMLEWEQWSVSTGDTDFGGFPTLLELHLEQCPKLQGDLPHRLSSLTKLVIKGCEQLSSSLPRLPQLHEMELKGCHHMLLSSTLETNSLTSLEIHNMRNLIYIPQGWLLSLRRLERLVISDCFELKHLVGSKNGLQQIMSLRHLIIRSCPSMISMSEELQRLPQYVEYLELDCCHSFERLPLEFHSLGSLKELVITDCPKLESFSGMVFPSNLKGLVLRGCGLESFPEYTINNIVSLEFLYISGCLVLTSFPRDERPIPTTFKQLTLDHCPNLEFLPEGMMVSSNISLELLEIFDCSSITSFPGGQLPKTLKTLTIWNCSNLESLADIITETMSLTSFRIGNCTKLKYLPSGLHTLIYLDYLELDGCPSIDSFPEDGLPSPRLKKMHILNCENLKFLAKRMQNLTSLEELRLSNCPMLASFPEDGLPVNLVSLDINNCENIKPCSQWGLHRLTLLKKLRIHGSCLNSDTFPEWLLPTTLETLLIVDLPSLKSLSPWLKNLTSLGELKIKDCHNILSLPNEGFPSMVSFLEISGCPVLQQNCEKDWSSVDHIPCIVM